METLADFPAYRLVKPTGRYYVDGDVIAIERHSERYGLLPSFHTFGSVAAYAMKYGECPEAALADAREKGHHLYWLNQNATMLTAEPRAKQIRPMHKIGDVVRFHGRDFRIEAAPNFNVALVEIAVAAVEG